MMAYIDRDGNTIGRSTWERLVSDESYCLVAADPLSPGLSVVTRWTGISDSEIDPRPFAFVTALWQHPAIGSAELLHDSMVMSVTESEARREHQRLVRRQPCGVVRREAAGPLVGTPRQR